MGIRAINGISMAQSPTPTPEDFSNNLSRLSGEGYDEKTGQATCQRPGMAHMKGRKTEGKQNITAAISNTLFAAFLASYKTPNQIIG